MIFENVEIDFVAWSWIQLHRSPSRRWESRSCWAFTYCHHPPSPASFVCGFNAIEDKISDHGHKRSKWRIHGISLLFHMPRHRFSLAFVILSSNIQWLFTCFELIYCRFNLILNNGCFNERDILTEWGDAGKCTWAAQMKGAVEREWGSGDFLE